MRFFSREVYDEIVNGVGDYSQTYDSHERILEIRHVNVERHVEDYRLPPFPGCPSHEHVDGNGEQHPI